MCGWNKASGCAEGICGWAILFPFCLGQLPGNGQWEGCCGLFFQVFGSVLLQYFDFSLFP